MYFYNAPPGVQVNGKGVQVETPTAAPPGGASSAAHMSSASWMPTPEERAVAKRVFESMPKPSVPTSDPTEEIDRYAQKLAQLRRNLSVTCAQRLWPQRRHVTAHEMLVLLIRDLEKTWRVHPPDVQRQVIVEDYKLLEESRPLPALVQGLELPNSVELVRLFEARCKEVASYGFWVAREEAKPGS